MRTEFLWLEFSAEGLIRPMLSRPSRLHSLSLEGRLQQSLAEHRAIMAAIKAGDATRAEKLMCDHILCGREALARMEARTPKLA